MTKRYIDRRRNFLPNQVGGKEKPRIMSYITPILVLLMVVSPLFIPIGVHVVHAIRVCWARLRAQAPTTAAPGRGDSLNSTSKSIEKSMFSCFSPKLFDHAGLFHRVSDDFDVAAVVNV
ncbi:hypothetical protein [Mycobacterium sp. 852002-51057_SCH5723018]|uniref:hypothetical protein n=1 Tax=Mycobacterium sp. 852002-51057_SCH5723018 TaxID=1834094 RepID=UPI0012E857CB|nr:hypothetical protein [Mycobacterium sp. 852002-51057_SCH5723018]